MSRPMRSALALNGIGRLVRSDARRGCNHLIYRDDDLRTDAFVFVGGIQGVAAAPEGMKSRFQGFNDKPDLL